MSKIRHGRIQDSATARGDFAVDFGSDLPYMVPVNGSKKYPVYDARTGAGIGSMTFRDIMKKMI